MLKPAALLLAAAVGRFASLFDGLFHDLYGDPDFARRWADPVERARLLRVAARLEREPSLLGMSDHLLAVARRP